MTRLKSKLKNYNVKQIDVNQLKINGEANHPLWEKAISLKDFCSPWDDKKLKKIEFRALWDKEYLFCSFKVDDNKVHIDTTDNTKNSINNSDRVELFFRANERLNPYYCLEIDPSSRIMDFKAKLNKEFDFKWNWSQKDILIKSEIQKDFFTIEVAISLASLTHLGLIKEGSIQTGIYRAKYSKQENGSYLPTWITWVNPNTETQNFHTPTSFGQLNLEGY
jgi:hypothetical protein